MDDIKSIREAYQQTLQEQYDRRRDGDIEIVFREKPHMHENFPRYIYNAFNDGWFRITTGQARGYGLIFKNIKITSQTPDHKSSNMDRLAYKASLMYVPSEYTNEPDWKDRYEKTNVWFVVDKYMLPQDAINIFKNDMKKWYP